MVGPRVNVGSLSAHVKDMSSRTWGANANGATSTSASLASLKNLKNGAKTNKFGADDSDSDSSSSSSGSDSDSDSDSDSEDKKKTTSKASFLSKVNGIKAEAKEAAPALVKVPAKATPTTNGKTKAAPAKKSDDTSSDSDTSSDEESDSDDTPAKKSAPVVAPIADKAKAKAEETSSEEDSSSSSEEEDSDDESSSDEEEAKPVVKEKPSKKAAAPVESDSDEEMADQSFAITSREAQSPTSQFTSQGFQLRRATADADASDVSRIFKQAKLEGKQVWYFTAPASVPVTVIEKMAIPVEKARQGKSVLSHGGEDYGVAFDDSITTKTIKLLIPNQSGDKYQLLNREIDQTMHLKRVTQFSQDSEEPAPVAAKIPRAQPAGLRSRFLPIGVTDSKKRKVEVTSKADSSSSDSDSDSDAKAAVKKPRTTKAKAVPAKVTPVSPPSIPQTAILPPVIPEKKTKKAKADADAMDVDEPEPKEKKTKAKKEKAEKKEKTEKKEKKDKKEKVKSESTAVKKVTPIPAPHVP